MSLQSAAVVCMQGLVLAVVLALALAGLYHWVSGFTPQTVIQCIAGNACSAPVSAACCSTVRSSSLLARLLHSSAEPAQPRLCSNVSVQYLLLLLLL
jgi:hypothetical protein